MISLLALRSGSGFGFGLQIGLVSFHIEVVMASGDVLHQQSVVALSVTAADN